MIRAANCLTVFVATVAITLGGIRLQANADPLADIGGVTTAAPITQAGYHSPGYFSGYSPPLATCSFGSHYACWYGAYGGRYCGCWAGGDRPACPYGYHFSCRYDGFGGRYCACF